MVRPSFRAALAIVVAPWPAARGADPPAATGPPFAISRETTHITEPLTDDGWPDYAAAILQRQRAHVTRENNGAVLYWQALGPGSAYPEDFSAIATELGFAPIDPTGADPFSDATMLAVSAWLSAQPSYSDAATITADSEITYTTIDRTMSRPWSAAQLPPLATWVRDHQASLDLLVAAASKQHWYDPSPSFLSQSPPPLVAAMLPGIQQMRIAGRALAVRSMFCLGEGDHAAALRDCRAIWQISNHALRHDWSLIEELVGIRLQDVARDATEAILSDPDLPVAVGTEILNDLSTDVAYADLVQIIDGAERWLCLDAAAWHFRMSESLHDFVGGEEMPLLHYLEASECDADATLREINRYYDEAVAAARNVDRDQRAAAFMRLEKQLSDRLEQFSREVQIDEPDRAERGRILGTVLAEVFIPGLASVPQAADRQRTGVDLARVAAALAVFRAHHNRYPNELAELAPGILEAIPSDHYSGDPLRYEQRGNGYLLYSVFENGIDDGGTDISGEVVDGEWIGPDDEPADLDFPDEGDLVIRVPLPPLSVPAPPSGGAVERADAAE